MKLSEGGGPGNAPELRAAASEAGRTEPRPAATDGPRGYFGFGSSHDSTSDAAIR